MASHESIVTALLLLLASSPSRIATCSTAPAPNPELPALAAGPVEPLDSSEFSGSFRSRPSVAKIGSTALLAWQESVPADAGRRQIFGRWLDEGRLQAKAFPLSSAPARSAAGASVALTPGGWAVVVWNSWGDDGARRNEGVWGRRGEPWRPFAVDSSFLDFPTLPAVAALSDDAFVVVWQGVARSGRRGLNGQLFHRSGSVLLAGEPFAIGEQTEILCPGAAVAAGTGGFEVVWGGRRERGEPMR